MPKNFDSSLNYDMLLVEFKAKWRQRNLNLKISAYDAERYKKVQAEYESWKKKNIEDRGLSYTFETTGEPKCLYVVLAGKGL